MQDMTRYRNIFLKKKEKKWLNDEICGLLGFHFFMLSTVFQTLWPAQWFAVNVIV